MMQVVASSLGVSLRSKRTALGLTQVELAARSGLPQQTISRIESGAYKETPPPDVIDALAEALDLAPATLLGAMGYNVLPLVEDDLPPDDPRAELIGLVKRVRLTPERVWLLRQQLQGMIEYDRKERGG